MSDPPSVVELRQLPQLALREPDSHKGDFGRVLLIGGSVGMAGSISLSGMAALRCGAGLLTVVAPDACQPTVAQFSPCYMTVPLPSDPSGGVAAEAVEPTLKRLINYDCAACGPGLGRGDGAAALVRAIQTEATLPVLFDADALTLLAHADDALRRPAGPRIFTPHAGEFARMLGVERIEAADRRRLAIDAARQWQAVVVLKGRHTLVTDGHSIYENTTGNPGLATGGTGDVLTGVITALIGQKLRPLEAAQLGVFLHGLAADLAAAKLGQVSLIASDLIDFLPLALQRQAAV